MLFIFVLHHASELEQLLDGPGPNDFLFVIEQLIKHPENLSSSHFLLTLSAFLLHQLNQRNELVEQCVLDLF